MTGGTPQNNNSICRTQTKDITHNKPSLQEDAESPLFSCKGESSKMRPKISFLSILIMLTATRAGRSQRCSNDGGEDTFVSLPMLVLGDGWLMRYGKNQCVSKSNENFVLAHTRHPSISVRSFVVDRETDSFPGPTLTERFSCVVSLRRILCKVERFARFCCQ